MCRKRVILWVMVVLVMTSCSPSKKEYALTVQTDVNEFAQDFIKLLRNKQVSTGVSLFSPEYQNAHTHSQLEQFSNSINISQDMQIKTVGYITETVESYTLTDIYYQIDFSQIQSHLILAEVLIKEQNGEKYVHGFQTSELHCPLEKTNALTFQNKPIINYIISLMTLCVLGITCYALWLCLKSKIKWKFAWTTLVLVGFGKLTFNWTFGELSWNILYAQLLNVSLVRSNLYAPWEMELSAPIGALIYIYMNYKKFRFIQ